MAERNGVRRQGEARRVVAERYPYKCCVVCGTTFEPALAVAHLDHDAGNNDPDNLAWMCGTHHWMFDAALYPLTAVKALRAHWQEAKGVPDHSGRMKNAGARADRTRAGRAAARKAAATRRGGQTAVTEALDPVRSAAARKAWETRRARRSRPSGD